MKTPQTKPDISLKRKVKLFQTKLGIYYLPTDVKTDVIVNTMKLGQIFEPEIVDIAKRFIKEGTAVLDLGASFGQMTLLFSEMVGPKGHVYSFEAADDVFYILNKNIEANNRKNITPYCNAVYDSIGETKFYPEPDFSRFGSYGSYGIDPKADHGRTVNTITIDSLNIKEPISFMKIDIQGCDLFALKGSRETIMRNRMPILFEYEEQFQNEFGTTFGDYMDFVESIQYRVLEVISNINFLIVPKEMHIDPDNRSKLKTLGTQFGVLRNKLSELPEYIRVMIAQYQPPPPYKGINSKVSYNRILDDKTRLLYQPIIEQMAEYLPQMMARKVPEANVQQAFILDSVYKLTQRPKILCVGAHEDTAAECLKTMGFPIEEIDPSLNYDLDTYFHLPTTNENYFDIIFSTSVIEHVEDDETFISQIADLLKPGGVGILTCDFNNTYKPGDIIPKSDLRLYTKKDILERLLPCAKGCTLIDKPLWDDYVPDFIHDGCSYAFATITFRKEGVTK